MGPLAGIKIIEFAALGPAPMGAMLLADLGAEVIRIERKQGAGSRPTADLFDPKIDILNRNRRVIALDLKKPEAMATALRLIEQADALLEGFRPGVMERLGLGPEICLARNPKLVYGRMTGWGQHGPLAHTAGHDINYLSLSGALHAIGERGSKPTPPLNLVADCGGGAMLLALGVLAGILAARQSGQGQVVDAAMTDGAASLMSMMYTLKAMGQWTQQRGDNLLDGGAHFYDTYACADGKWLSVGAIEPQFYALLLEKTGITDPAFQAPFLDRGIPVEEVFYCGESVLLPAFRGQGLGHRFFDEREAHARSLGGIRWTSFASVNRASDDPRRPADYRGNDVFWTRRGYTRQPDMQVSLPWKQLGEAHESEQTLTMWLRPLEAGQ